MPEKTTKSWHASFLLRVNVSLLACTRGDGSLQWTLACTNACIEGLRNSRSRHSMEPQVNGRAQVFSLQYAHLLITLRLGLLRAYVDHLDIHAFLGGMSRKLWTPLAAFRGLLQTSPPR